MSLRLRRNRHNGTGGKHGSHERLIQICRTYAVNPFAVPLPAGLRPSDMIRPLLNNTPSSRHKFILGNAIYYRLKSLKRRHGRKITAMLLDQLSSRGQLLHILDNDPVFRIEEARVVYEAYLRRHRDETALVEEAQLAPATTLGQSQRNRDAPNQARTQMQTQYQSQPMVRTRTHRNPRDNARGLARGEPQITTEVNGVTIRPPFTPTQPRPQPQPRQEVVVNAHNRVVRPAANGGRGLLFEFEYQNGWLICRNIETGGYFVLHERTIVAMFAIMVFLDRWRWQLLSTLVCILTLFWLQFG